jgi:hypothetical protein
LFISWAASKTAADFKEMVMHGQINRQEILRSMLGGFAAIESEGNPP